MDVQKDFYIDEVKRDYIDDLLPGYRFCPTDLELIVNYLQAKIDSRKLLNCRIHEVYLYDHTPEDLAEKHRSCDNKWYFLTSRERMCPQGNRPKRITKKYGFWRMTQKKTEVCDERGQVVGYKGSLAFHEKKKGKTTWLMHEYIMNDPNLPFGSGTDGNKLNDWVLCKIYKKKTSQTANNNRAEQVQNNRNQEGENEEQNQAHDEPAPKRQRLSVNNQGINQPNCSLTQINQQIQVQEAAHYDSGTHIQIAEPVQSVFNSNQQLVNNINTGGQMEFPTQTSDVNHDIDYDHHDTMHPMDNFCGSNFIQPTTQDPDQVFAREVAQSPLWNSTYEYQQNQSMCASTSTSIESRAAAAQPLSSTSPVTSRDLPWDAVDITPQLDDYLTGEWLFDTDFINSYISFD